MLLRLLVSFMMIGLGAFGGGNVAIPLVRHEVVTRYSWLSGDEFAEIVALAQMTPGPLAINAATYTGFRVSGIAGAVVATIGVILPSAVIVSSFIAVVNMLGDRTCIGGLRRGVRPGVLVMFALAVWSVGEISLVDGPTLALAIAAYALLMLTRGRLHPVVLIIAFGALGALLL